MMKKIIIMVLFLSVLLVGCGESAGEIKKQNIQDFKLYKEQDFAQVNYNIPKDFEINTIFPWYLVYYLGEDNQTSLWAGLFEATEENLQYYGDLENGKSVDGITIVDSYSVDIAGQDGFFVHTYNQDGGFESLLYSFVLDGKIYDFSLHLNEGVELNNEDKQLFEAIVSTVTLNPDFEEYKPFEPLNKSEQIVLSDKNNVKVTYIGVEKNEIGNTLIYIEIENNTDNEILIKEKYAIDEDYSYYMFDTIKSGDVKESYVVASADDMIEEHIIENGEIKLSFEIQNWETKENIEIDTPVPFKIKYPQ